MAVMETNIAADKEVHITRVFDAPRELVFKAWTNPQSLARWFAPSGCEIRFAHIDVREGGEFHSCIRTPDGYECWCRGTYREVTAPERIVMTMAVADEAGNYLKAADAGMDAQWPDETTVTIDFAEDGGKTTINLHQTVSEELAKKTGAYPSWLSMFDQLDNLLAA